jgi:hypothetical protein
MKTLDKTLNIKKALGAAAGVILAGTLLVGFFYCLAVFTTLLPAFLREPGPAPVTSKDRLVGWARDIDYFASQLPRLHPGPFSRVSQAEFEKQIVDLKAGLPQKSDQEITAELMRITALLRDGHTRVTPGSQTEFNFFPLRLYWFADGVYVTGAAPEYQSLIGARLVKVGGTPFEQVVKTVAPFISYDNENGLKNYIHYTLCAEFLQFSGLIPNGAKEAVFTFEKGGNQMVKMAIKTIPDKDYDALSRQSFAEFKLFYRPERQKEAYWFEYLPQAKVLYIQYNACQEQDTLPMNDFAAQVAQALKANPVERLVVDLRMNGGGNSDVIKPLFKVIVESSLNQKGKLFVLIGRETFSSAVLNMVDFARQSQATFVGEAAGGSPSHFGEVRSFILPNSGVKVRYSCKHFVAQGYENESFSPDVPISVTYADYAAGRDPVLEYVIK